MASNPLNIVLTNDDGFDAPGLQTLYRALVAAGHNVHIVAPHTNQSAQGSSLGGVGSLSSPIDVTEFSLGNYWVDGRPATATLTALDDLFAGNPPDLVISGTNRGENIGTSENISGTVGAAVQALFEGVPGIAVSASSYHGSYDTGFANAAGFVVNFLDQLQDAQTTGAPLLPEGQGLSINVPGNPNLDGVAVTTITSESTAAYPYQQTDTGTWAEDFVPNTAPSGSTTAEGSLFLNNHVTISPIDGNWGATDAARDALAARLGSTLPPTGTAHAPLNILLLDEDGHGSAGIVATRDALLAAGYDVTVLAPATDQSGVGSALYLSEITVTQYSAHDYAANGTPSSLAALALDPDGLFGGVKPDLIVVGADQGNAVGIENANHSATVATAAGALFNYEIPAIAVTSEGGAAGDLATSAAFVTALIQNLQATQGSAATLLPAGIGLSINVPTGASIDDFAFTTIDGGTNADLGVTGNGDTAQFVTGAAVTSTHPHSEGNAFNAGQITVSPIDGNFALQQGNATYDWLSSLIGTTYGDPNAAAHIGGDFVITADHGQSVVLTTADLNGTDPDSADAALVYTVTAATSGQIVVDGATATSFTQQQLEAGDVAFARDAGGATTASFSVTLGDGSGLTTAATVNAASASEAFQFDANYYLEAYPDVAAAVANGQLSSAKQHYDVYGWHEGRDPNSFFDTSDYLAGNPDVAAAGVNPWDHYVTFGVNENRAPSAEFVSFDAFDWRAYVNANPDLTVAGIDTATEAYAHFVRYGEFESRAGVHTKDGLPIGPGGVPHATEAAVHLVGVTDASAELQMAA